MAMQMNVSATSDTFRYWNAVPTGMSIAVPGTSAVTQLRTPSSRQISPWPANTYQNSLTVA